MTKSDKTRQKMTNSETVATLNNFAKNKEFLSFFNNRKYSIGINKETTYRMINHWTELGLIDDYRESTSMWRKFSIKDVAWQRIIMELRKFGFPNDKIKIVKKHLLDNGTGQPLFEFYIARAMQKNPTFILVYDDGIIELITDQELTLSEKIGALNKNYIKISINNILQKLFPKKDFSPLYTFETALDDEELEIISKIRTGKFTSIEVEFKNGKIDIIKSKEIIDIEKRIIDIMRECNFQTITIKKEDSKKPAYILRERKEKIKATE